MRTTVDLPPHLHEVARALARSSSQTLSQTIVALLETALPGVRPSRVVLDPVTGLKTARLDRAVTHDDVRRLEDDR